MTDILTDSARQTQKQAGQCFGQLLQAVDAVSKGQRFLGPDVAELAVQGFTAPGDDALDTLSVRERQIVLLVVQGPVCAHRIGCSDHAITLFFTCGYG